MQDETHDEPIEQLKRGTTCFSAYARHKLPCLNNKCRMWIDNACNQNCVFIAIANNKCEGMTLQQIGDIHNLTRMRVCQIEKRAVEKLKRDAGDHSL